MRALLVGFGGIGKSVYHPELTKLGYTIDILDKETPGATFTNVAQVTSPYDLAVICTPNYTHEQIAYRLASIGTGRIFIEKPGLLNSELWNKLCTTYPGTQFHLVKNNLYRSNYGDLLNHANSRPLIGVDMHWLNANRIPNPGSWFTNKAQSFGGVSRDLMPHLYCFAAKLFGTDVISNTPFKSACFQRWNLDLITSTDYGTVDPKGTYDVDDTALAAATVNGVQLKLSASWKEGYDKQSITLFFKDGGTFEWQFGLCPSEAYGVMLQDTTDSYMIDMNIHRFLEDFND